MAVLSAATNARWSDPNIELTLRGGELPAGPMRLEAGVAEFAFAGGATAVVEGPAVFEPVAADRLVLQSGRAIGRCATATAKLTIVTPNAAVTDLGTEFGVTVGDDQQTRVAVIKGAVELAAGNVPHRLIAGEAVAVDAHGQMVPAEFVIAEFSKMATLLPPEDFAVETGANLLSDPGMKIPPGLTSTLPWHGSVGYVDLAAPGVARSAPRETVCGQSSGSACRSPACGQGRGGLRMGHAAIRRPPGRPAKRDRQDSVRGCRGTGVCPGRTAFPARRRAARPVDSRSGCGHRPAGYGGGVFPGAAECPWSGGRRIVVQGCLAVSGSEKVP